MSLSKPAPLKAITLAWLTASTMDITAACIQYYIRTGKGPGGVLRFVASGVFGKKAFGGGTAMAGWGLLFHYGIAFCFTLFFYWIYPRLKFMEKNLVLSGLLYGALVWCIMNLLVVPASQAPVIPFVLKKAAIALLILMGCIGLPIALIIGGYYRRLQRGTR